MVRIGREDDPITVVPDDEPVLPDHETPEAPARPEPVPSS